MIKNIVFDMGNVLIRFEPQEIMSNFVIREEDWELLHTQIFRCPEWGMTDAGTITDEGMEERVLSRLPERLHETASLILEQWHEHMPLIPDTEELVKQLKEQGYGIYLLSNASKRFHLYAKRIPALQYFDGVMVSADVRMVKPNPEIYQKLFAEFSLNPAECYFIDDRADNITGAAACGMAGYRFLMDFGPLCADMRAHGIRI